MNNKMIKKTVVLLLIMVLITSLAGCGGKSIDIEKSEAIRIGIVLTTQGLGDKNFNDMAYGALERAKEELGIEFDYSEPRSNGDFEIYFREFAQSGSYDLIIALGYESSEALKKVANEFPDQKFTIVDAKVECDNVSSIFKNFEEQTFLSGVLAGLTTKDTSIANINSENIVGVVIGADSPLLRSAITGFTAGVKYINRDAEILTGIVGSWSDPGKAKEISISMYERGADIILQAAGGSGLGVFNAAEEANGYAMGTGANQNHIKPDQIIATATYNLPKIVFDEVKLLTEDKWEVGQHTWGIKQDAVGYSVENSNVKLSPEIIEKVEEIRQLVVLEKLSLPKTLEDIDEWLKNNPVK